MRTYIYLKAICSQLLVKNPASMKGGSWILKVEGENRLLPSSLLSTGCSHAHINKWNQNFFLNSHEDGTCACVHILPVRHIHMILKIDKIAKSIFISGSIYPVMAAGEIAGTAPKNNWLFPFDHHLSKLW